MAAKSTVTTPPPLLNVATELGGSEPDAVHPLVLPVNEPE